MKEYYPSDRVTGLTSWMGSEGEGASTNEGKEGRKVGKGKEGGA